MASPASPTLACHSVRTGMLAGNSDSSAIFGPGEPEQPASNNTPTRKSRRISPLQRGLVGGSRLGTSLLRSEYVPALRGIEGFEARMRFRFQNFQRCVGLVVVEQYACEPQCGDRAYLIAPGVLDDPLQLRARRLQVSRLKLDFGRHQRRERRVGATRKVFQNRSRSLPSRLEIIGARRLLQRVVQHGGLRGLRALIPRPAVPGRESGKHQSRAEDDRTAALLPPGFQGGELFLLFEIVRAHSFSPVPKSRSDIASARRSCGTRNCPRSSRKALIPASPAWASSSPTITATGAPLASAFFICDLKLPPPQCWVTLKPASRRASATRNAERAASSPWLTRYTSGQRRSPESETSASRRSSPIAQPHAGAGLPPTCSNRPS